MPIRAIFVTFLSTCLMFSLPAMGKVIHVPADQPTIQAGINAAANGDTVLVSAGTYYENINFDGKAITVTSASGPTATVIDGSKGSTGVTVNFSSGEKLTSVISGFTIQNGSNVGINVSSASPTITGNIPTMNANSGNCGTGAIVVEGGSPLIQGNLIVGNATSNCNGYAGIYAGENSAIQVVGNVVSGNGGGGIGIYQASSAVNVSQNTITQNHGPGLFVYSGAGPVTVIQNLIASNQGTGLFWYDPPITAISNTITNNAVACCSGNTASEINGGYVDSTVVLENNLAVATGDVPAFYCGGANGAPKLVNNDVFALNSAAYGGSCQDQTGSDGNISADPLFVDLLGENFHIQAASPAVDAGSNSAPDEPKTDMDGDARTVGGTIDIGADEYSANTALTLSSLALHFSAEDVGSTSTPQEVTLTNQTAQAVTLNLIATGANYSQTNTCGTSLAAGASCQISVTFSPMIGGTVDGAVGVFTTATTNPLVVNLVGTGLAPQIQLPCCFYFNDVVVGTSSTSTSSATNSGQAPLTITSIVYSGSSDFTETNNCPIAPNTLAVGASCTVSITYTPTIVGNESGIVSFTDNAPQSPQYFSVNGNSVSAGIPALNPTSLSFPTTLVGQSSAPQTSTLTNTGTGALGIQEIFSGGDFQETNNCPSGLAAGASCTITVTFTPSYSGNESGYVDIFTDSAYFNSTLSLTGTGLAPVPTLSSLSLTSTPAGSTDTQVTAAGTGFINGSQVLWNGVALGYSYSYGSTQINFTIPAADIITPGTYQISVFTPAPGGGVSNSLPFVVYQPINYAASSTKYDYKTITGTNLNLSYYNSAQIVSPFPIQFGGGGSYSTLTVGGDGVISFNGFYSYYNSPIPDLNALTLVAPFWDTLYPFGSGTDNNVFWQVLGSEPNRELVVEWRDVGYCCETNGLVTFEVVFFEGSSEVEFNYADTTFGNNYSSHDNGATASVGMQVSSNLGTQYSYYQPSIKSNTALLWSPSSPNVTVSTSSLSFGYHQIGSRSKAQKLTVTNGGNVAVTISSVTVDNVDFQLVNKCGTTLKPHKSCSMHLFFDPSTPVAETATLSINDDATNSPQTVALSGTGSVTPILIYPILANFGNVPVGQTGTVPVILANAANKPLTIQGITATPSVYTETNNCGTSLAAGTSCTVNVSFTPLQQGNVTGKIAMVLNGKPAVNEVKLVGSGQ